MNIKALSKIKHNGTVYENGSTILNISPKDAERLVKLKVAEEVKDNFIKNFIDDEDPKGKKENQGSETDDENPKQGKKKKSDSKKNEE